MRTSRFRAVCCLIIVIYLGGTGLVSGAAVPPHPVLSVDDNEDDQKLEERLQQMEELNRRLVEQVERLSGQVEGLQKRLDERETQELPPPIPSPPRSREEKEVRNRVEDEGEELPPIPNPTGGGEEEEEGDEDSVEPAPQWNDESESDTDDQSSLEVGYDRGFFIRDDDGDGLPYEFRAQGRIQFRAVNFVRSARFFFDSAGDPQLIQDRDDFDIERARLIFSGFIGDPRLTYFFQLDGDTDDRSQVDLLDVWAGYQFNDAFGFYFGKRRLPGSRAWLLSTKFTQFADRSLTTSFFRPDRSQGIWAEGEPIEDWHYLTMVSNGFSTNGLRFDDFNNTYSFTGSVWHDIGEGGFGNGPSDLSFHHEPVAQVGTSVGFERGSPVGPFFLFGVSPQLEFVRLSDGTRITKTGALAPDVTVTSFDHYLWALDAAYKFRGLSLSAEYYFRWLQGIKGDGPLPRTTLFDNGFYAQAGYFVIPERVELIARTSQVFGSFGNASEYAGGLNWFFRGSHDLKLTVDVSRVIGSPVSNTGTDYQPGQIGVLFRSQLQAAY